MARRRKMIAGDVALLRKCFRKNGAAWTYRCLAWVVGAMEHNGNHWTKLGRWTDQRLAALRFLCSLSRDYTFNALYDTAMRVDGGFQSRLLNGKREAA